MNQYTSKTHAAIDKRLEEKQGTGFRRHLGASIIGRVCPRQSWYIFRWAKATRVKGRILRLWDRGNLEEERFIGWLRDAGIHAAPIDPDTGEQYRIGDHNDHFGGSLDARLFDTPDFPGEWILGEFKTHNDKSFKELKKVGMRKAKPEHYAQMQVYMHYEELKNGMYFAINKNDDDIHTEIVEYDSMIALQMIDRARKVIETPVPPARISESPAWFVCQMCDFSQICHSGAKLAVNCRTCVQVKPVEDGKWLCTRYNYELSDGDQRRACKDHTPIE